MSKSRLDVLEQIFKPLQQNQPVSLIVDDERLPKKTRKYRTVLVIVPMTGPSYPKGCLLVSMPPYGAELIDPQTELKSISFIRLGLKHSLAKALTEALTQVLKGETI